MEKFLSKKIEIWIVLLLAIILVIAALIFGSVVRQASVENEGAGGDSLATAVTAVAAFPETVTATFKHINEGGNPGLMKLSKSEITGDSGFTFYFKKGTRPDLEYLLLNRYDGDLKFSVSELWDLNSQEMVHSWDWSRVDRLLPNVTLNSDFVNIANATSPDRFRSAHALISEKGKAYTHSHNDFLIEADLCSNLKIFNQDRIYHHSLEFDHDGNIWTNSLIEPNSLSIGSKKFRDDGIALISPGGEKIFEKSIGKLLIDNGLSYVLFGSGPSIDDPIHINDVEPVLADGEFWKKGDVFLSFRNRSMVLLYRPSTNKVLWHKWGPWMHQHDVDIISNHEISIFNNNAALYKTKDWAVWGVNDVVIYNFRTGDIKSPWRKAFKKWQIKTHVEGLSEVIGKELFVEDTIHGTLVQFDATGTLVWQYINSAKDGSNYYVNWSRIVSRRLGNKIKTLAREKKC